MKVIFFDVDDVLNRESTEERTPTSGRKGIDSELLDIFQSVAWCHNCKLVLMGDWKKCFNDTALDDMYLVKKLYKDCRNTNFIVGMTPDSIVGKGIEVMVYLNTFGSDIDDFTIFSSDVKSFECAPQTLKHLIQTSHEDGIKSVKVLKDIPKKSLTWDIVEYLKGKPYMTDKGVTVTVTET